MKNTYTEMKDSGVEWIGKVPQHWTMQKIKTLFSLRKEKNYLPLEEVNLISLYTDKGVIQHDDLEETTGNKASNADGYKKVYTNDIVVNIILCWMGAIGYSQYAGVTSPAYDVYMPLHAANSRFYHYLFRTNGFSGECYTRGRGIMAMRWRTYSDQFRSITVVHPPIVEQEAIAAYLDEKCAAIDEIIEQAKATIEEYKAWKSSVIFEAVTKGLDPHAEMKDSGVEWIGKVPKCWNICKTLRCLVMPITDGPHTTPELFDSGIPFVSAEAVSCGNGRIDFSHIRGFISQEFYAECCKKYIPQRDDIYMIKSGATTGKVAMVDVDHKFTIWSPLAVFRVNTKRMMARYLFYFLQSNAYQKQVELEWSFGTQQNIGMRVLENLLVCLPSLTEQANIITAIDEKCAAIDGIIAEKEALIADMEAYKKSLIFETVTGKRKVC